MRTISKDLLLIALTLGFTIGGYGQTSVSGGIYSNTTWSQGDSPFIVEDTVVVFQGVTLTIEPGVVVKFEDTKFIDVRGRLNAIGTITDTIRFTSNNPMPSRGIYQGIKKPIWDSTIFVFCRFDYANWATYHGNQPARIEHCWFEDNHIAVFGDGPVNNCMFRNNDQAVRSSYESSFTNSIFENNRIGITHSYENIFDNNTFLGNSVGIHMLQRDSIRNNAFYFNDTAIYADAQLWNVIHDNDIVYNKIGIQRHTNGPPQMDEYFSNRICHNTLYNVRTEAVYNLDFSNNCWCEYLDSIPNGIYDGYDNIEIGLIQFMPYDTCDTPDIPLGNKLDTETFLYSVYPNPTSDILYILGHYGHKVVWIRLLNAMGQELLVESQKDLGIWRLDLRNFSTSIYFLQINIEGNTHFTRVVVEH